MVPDTPQQQLAWLVDRAAISELLYSFARALDERDFATYIGNYAEGGVLDLPDPVRPGERILVRREEMATKVPASLTRYAGTHHISSNHQIEVNGERARSRSYLQAAHVRGAPSDYWAAGGWYDCEYVRTGAGWRFAHVRLHAVWVQPGAGPIRPED